MIPVMHREFIDNAVAVLKQDPRIRAAALSGSYMTGNMDEFSDLDFMLAVEPESFTQVLEERVKIAEKLAICSQPFRAIISACRTF